ncbi:MAG: hypothetical protein AAB466_13205 [Verrucomicrobiota bacterium]
MPFGLSEQAQLACGWIEGLALLDLKHRVAHSLHDSRKHGHFSVCLQLKLGSGNAKNGFRRPHLINRHRLLQVALLFGGTSSGLFPISSQARKSALEQYTVLLLCSTAHDPKVDQGCQDGQSGKPEASEPIENKRGSVQVWLQQGLSPNQELARQDQKEGSKPAAPSIHAI